MVLNSICVKYFYCLMVAWEKNDIIFGANMSPSVHIVNKKKGILILGFGPTQGLHDTTLTAEAQYSII